MDKSKKKYTYLILTVCLAAFIVSLDSYIVNISLPTIGKQFNADMDEISLVTLSYLLFMASTSLIFGKLADRISLKTMFIYGYAIFLISSFMCGISQNIYTLLAGRSIQGIGGAMLSIAGYAAIPKFLPPEIRGWAFGIITTAASLGVIMGAPAGGIINGYFSWHWIFFINVPISAFAIFFAYRNVPDEIKSGEVPPFDVYGAVLSFITILSITYLMNKGKELGFKSPLVFISIIVFLASLILFIMREKNCASPLLNFEIFKNRVFKYGIMSTITAFMVLAGSNFLIPFYLEKSVSLTPAKSGFVLMIYSVVYIIIAPIAGRTSDRIDPRKICIIAMLLAMCSSILFAMLLNIGITAAIIFIICFALSYGFFIAPNNNTIMNSVSDEEKGSASGVYNLFLRLSLIIGVSLFENIYSLYIFHITGNMGQNIPPEVMNKGFHMAYIIGGFLCIASSLSSFFSLREKVKRKGIC